MSYWIVFFYYQTNNAITFLCHFPYGTSARVYYFPRSRSRSRYFLSREIVPNCSSPNDPGVWVVSLLYICDDSEPGRLWNSFKVDSYEIFHSVFICIPLISISIGCLFICFLALYLAVSWMGCSYLLPCIFPLGLFPTNSQEFFIYFRYESFCVFQLYVCKSPSLWLTVF